jgi:hypothetical protein
LAKKVFVRKLIEESQYSVYFSNLGEDLKEIPWSKGKKHLADWVGHFVPPGYSFEECKKWIPMHSWIIERLYQWAKVADTFSILDPFVDEAVNTIAGNVPDSTTLQEVLEGRISESTIPRPEDLVELVCRLVSVYFPAEKFTDMFVPEAFFKGVLVRPPVRVTATLLCVSLVCEEANRGDEWYRRHYKPSTQVKRAGCRMAHGIYLYRRHSNASISQIATIFKTATWE